MALPVTITGISVDVACVGPFKGYSSSIGSGSSHNSNSFGSSSTFFQVAQSFTTVGAITVNDVGLWLGKIGTPTDNAFIEIHSGSETGTLLGTSDDVAASTITAAGAHTNFHFSSGVSLSATTQYWIVVNRDGSADASNYYTIFGNAAGIYTGGNYSNLNGASWTQQTGTDAYFIINPSDAYYFFGRDGTTATTYQAYKATDPSSSWSSVATKTGIGDVSIGGTTGGPAGFKLADIIHLATGTANSGGQKVNYNTFDMSTDSFVVSEAIIGTLFTGNGQTGSPQYGCSVVVRSNGNVVAFFNGVQTKKSGTNYARVYWSERTGVNTWSAAVEVDDAGAADHVLPEAALGDADRVHFIWKGGTSNLNERSLSSGNSLDTQQQGSFSTTEFSTAVINTGSAIRINVMVSVTGYSVLYFDSGANPTLHSANPASLGAGNTGSLPNLIMNDGTDLYAMQRVGADSDLYLIKSTDNGLNYSLVGNVFTGTVSAALSNLSIDGNIYQRGSNYVIPYVVNDNGTLKYNEYVVRSLTTSWAGTAAPSIELALSVTATLQMLAASTQPVLFNIAANPTITTAFDPQISTVLAVTLNLNASASRYSPISSAPSLVASLSANALRFTPTTALQSINTNLLASTAMLVAASSTHPVVFNFAAQALRFTNGLAAPQINFNLSATTIQNLSGLATLPITLNMLAGPIQRMMVTAVLPVQFNLLADASIQGAAGQAQQITALLAATLDMRANAVRYSPVSAVLAASADLIANAVRYTPASAAPSIITNLSASVIQAMAAVAAPSVIFNLAASMKQLMIMQSTLPINFNMAANAARFTPTTTLLAAELSLNAAAVLRMQINATLPVVFNVTASPVQRLVALESAPIVFSMAAFATIAGQVTAWNGSALLSIVLSMQASPQQFMMARTTASIVAALSATANIVSQVQTVLSINTNLLASTKLLLGAQASMAIETAMQVNAKARLAAYAGLMAELTVDARANIRGQIMATAPVEFSLSALPGLRALFRAVLALEFNMSADGVLNPLIILPPRPPTTGVGRFGAGESRPKQDSEIRPFQIGFEKRPRQ